MTNSEKWLVFAKIYKILPHKNMKAVFEYLPILQLVCWKLHILSIKIRIIKNCQLFYWHIHLQLQDKKICKK